MRQTPLKEEKHRSAQGSQICMFYSGQKQEKISAKLYGSISRQLIKHQPNYIPMNKVTIIDDKRCQPQPQSLQTTDLKKDLFLLRQQIANREALFQQEIKIKNEKELKIKRLFQQLQSLKKDNQDLFALAMKGDELKHEMRRQKANINQKINNLNYQVNSSILFQERQSILAMKHLRKQQLNIMKLNSDLQDLKQVSLRKRQQIESVDKQIAQENKRIQNNMETIYSLNHDLKIVNTQFFINQLQISVLKMQTNPSLRVGFSTVSLDPQGDRKRILEKNSNSWTKNKIKNLSLNQIRDFLIMQLYPSWKKMLNRLSSQFTGYRELLCYEPTQQGQKVPDISLYLPQKNPSNRATNNKTRSLIVLYSPIAKNGEEVIKTAMGLAGLRNRVIKILSVKIQQTEGNCSQLQISYQYLGFQKLKKIEVIWLKTLTRQTLIKYLPNHGDKVVLLKLEIPLILNSVAEKLQLEQVFELIRRCKC